MSPTRRKSVTGCCVRKRLSGSMVHKEKRWGSWLFKKLNEERRDREGEKKGKKKGGREKLVVNR